jgi:hypothetical protein
MHWIIQSNLYKEKMYETIIDTFNRFGFEYSEHKVVPFIGELEPVATSKTKNVICIGSYSMRHIAKKMGWTPGVFDIYDQDFEVQRIHWGPHMLNYKSHVTEFKHVDFKDLAFLRPTTDSKVFSGKIFEEAEFKEWQKTVCEMQHDYGSSLTPETLIQVSEPLNIYSEYRFWIVKNKIVTYSMYKRGSQVFYSSEVDQRFIDYVSEVIKIWAPHETYVIDVCDTDRGLRIVEPNTLNAAGFYAGNMQKLVFELNEAYSE